jgi:hypothetical protein
MNKVQIELARKLREHGNWDDYTLLDSEDGARSYLGIALYHDEQPEGVYCLPDLTDDATAGVLLGMWRDAVKANGDDYEGCSSRAYRASCVGLMRAAFWDQEGQTHMAELFARMLLDAWSAQ